ncbi:MAG: hypothetical protein IGS48_02260 [Oscillatoriales cyanobacterium C42_A2020_001]|nr:hypothetical protein [Leptolyngbyaceae cyanobacterium C42_A2020_001]
MFKNFFNQWLDHRHEEHFQLGCRDRLAGSLPKLKDAAYLSGYFADRPEGLDSVMQFFPTVEQYWEWKQRSLNS